MAVTVIVGAQWGDEGKGRTVDYMAAQADVVIRFPGGDNAGHTVVNEHGRFALHLLPCVIFYPHVRNLLGAGTVVNLDTVSDELATVQQAGIDADNLWIDLRAHLIWPYHRQLDGAAEDWRRRQAGQGDEERGTTRRGNTVAQGRVEPVYETWPGWRIDTSGCRTWNDLPPAARAYLRRIEELAAAPIRFVSVGPERSQMVVVDA